MCILLLAIFYPLINGLPQWMLNHSQFYYCAIAGGFGGIFYCFRGVYINYSVKKQWDKNWEIWYYIRPLVSIIAGVVSFLFLKAGLLILESQEVQNSANYGFLAIAFIAGLNVDNFMKKIEDIAESAWGINKSKTSKEDKLK